MQDRFIFESECIREIMTMLEERFEDEIGAVVVRELREIVGRMAFRFRKTVEAGNQPRPDEYPLSVVRRLCVYTSDTAPAFYKAMLDSIADVQLASSFESPAMVIDQLLEKLISKNLQDTGWTKIKAVAERVATDIVNRNQYVVADLVKTVGGYTKSPRFVIIG
jgi:hypothetical protein